jgi:SNF2 family DNA or RNA helicase
MRVVHGFWAAGRGLCVWAERSELPVTSPSQAVRSARPHPFAATAENLAELLSGVARGTVTTSTLLLPSMRRSPLDSPEMVRVRPRIGSSHPPLLLPWTVPSICVEPADARAVLELPLIDARFGASMHYLGEVAAFAGTLVERGRVVPAVEEAAGGDRPTGRWRPVLQGPDVVTVDALVAAMPPVCRAEATSESSAGSAPSELVTAALSALTDAVVRSRLRETSLLLRRRGRRPARIPAAEAWLASLTSADPHFDAAAHDAADLARSLEPWTEFGAGPAGPARLTFRLTEHTDETEAESWARETDQAHEPEGDGPDGTAGEASADGAGRWRLEFWLQSTEDPSLMVPAEQVWAAGDTLGRWMSHPDEVLLTELGRATSVYPALGDAMRGSRPSGLDLDVPATYDFLIRRAAVLDQAGFGVLLPSWWTSRRRVGLRGSARSPEDARVNGGRFSREALVDFQWHLAVGDDLLSEDELAMLASTKAPLVRLRGQWVAVDPDHLQRGLDFLDSQSDGTLTAIEVIALAASHPDDLDTPLPVTSIEADGSLGELLAGTVDRALVPLDVPPGLVADLRPYQSRGLSWLAFLSDLGLGACLADDMGLGKTVQLLALEAHERGKRPDDRPDARPTLLLCPVSLVGNWQREAARFTPQLRVYAHHGSDRLHGADLEEQLERADIVLTTYQTVIRDIDELAEHPWDRVVLDEAQAVKNSRSRSARAVRRLQAGHRVALTGTPMENRLSELWSIMDVLNPGILGSAERFRASYAIPVERHGQTEPAERLRRIIRPYLLRRVKTDPGIIDDLPAKIEITQHYRLTTEQASLYQAVVDEMMGKIESTTGIERRGNVLAAMTKLKQVCNHPAQMLHDHSTVARRSGKVNRLEEIVEEILAEGDKALLFTQFTDFADLLLPHLSTRFDTEVLYLHGGTPKQRRDEMVARFQSDDGPALFLLSLKAGGTGLNLTAANHVIHTDRWWNPAVENQATDRAFRIGQRRSVQVRKFVCTGTLEERIDEMIQEKKALADAVVADGERWLTELSTSALRDLFTLSAHASDE